MESKYEGRLSCWLLVALLVFLPLIRGGNQIWVSLMVTSGMGFLLVLHASLGFWYGGTVFEWRPEDSIFILVLLWCVFGLFRQFSPPDAFDSFLILLGCFACFLTARRLSFSGFTFFLALSLILIGAVLSLIGIFQFLHFLPCHWWNPRNFLASTFVNHNHFAAYLELLLPLSYALALTGPLKPLIRFLVILTSTLLAITLLLSGSRGAWISLFVSSLFWMVWYFRGQTKEKKFDWRKSNTVFLAGLLILGGIIYLVVKTPMLDRLESFFALKQEAGTWIRQAIWRGTLRLIGENTLMGHGLGSFVFAFPRFRPPGLFHLANAAHNEYLEIISEIGLIGLLLVIGMGAVIVRRMMYLVRLTETNWKQAIGLAGLIGLGSVALHSLIDFPWRIPAVAFEGSMLAGLISGISYKAEPFPLRELRFSFKGAQRIGALSLATLMSILAIPMSRLIAADIYALQAEREIKKGNLDKAVVNYRQAAAKAPFRSKYWKRFGDHLTQENRFKEAEGAYQQALALNSFDVWSAQGLGAIEQRFGKWVEADYWLSHAVRYDPQNPLFLKNLGELKLIRGESQAAAKAFRQAVKLTRPYSFLTWLFSHLDDPDYFIQLGESSLFKGQLELAESAFNVARELDSSQQEFQAGLALVALSRGDFDGAQRLMDSIRSVPAQAQYHAWLAAIRLKEGRLEEVRQILDRSLAEDPKGLLAYQIQFLWARATGKKALEREALKKLLSLNRHPVSVQSKSSKWEQIQVIWEPEKKQYAEGGKVWQGWGLFTNGSISEAFVLPPGRIRFEITASGSPAGGHWPVLNFYWNGRLFLRSEWKFREWSTREVEVEVHPGESLARIEFLNDENNPEAHEDRNLNIDKVIASWEFQ